MTKFTEFLNKYINLNKIITFQKILEIGQHSTPHKDGQPMFLPSVGHRQLKMPKRFGKK